MAATHSARWYFSLMVHSSMMVCFTLSLCCSVKPVAEVVEEEEEGSGDASGDAVGDEVADMMIKLRPVESTTSSRSTQSRVRIRTFGSRANSSSRFRFLKRSKFVDFVLFTFHREHSGLEDLIMKAVLVMEALQKD